MVVVRNGSSVATKESLLSADPPGGRTFLDSPRERRWIRSIQPIVRRRAGQSLKERARFCARLCVPRAPSAIHTLRLLERRRISFLLAERCPFRVDFIRFDDRHARRDGCSHRDARYEAKKNVLDWSSRPSFLAGYLDEKTISTWIKARYRTGAIASLDLGTAFSRDIFSSLGFRERITVIHERR